MPLIMIFICAAWKPPHNNSCGPLPKKRKIWYPDLDVYHVTFVTHIECM
jgi:hypothetical protein